LRGGGGVKDFDPTHKFFVGQEVVCVRAEHDPKQNTTLASGLVEGKVYRIRWLGVYRHYLDGDYLGIKVEGIIRPTCPVWGYVDPPFYADRFRPVKHDPIAGFRNLVAPQDGDRYMPAAPEGPRRKLPTKVTEEV
jgi:hypothetical protein